MPALKRSCRKRKKVCAPDSTVTHESYFKREPFHPGTHQVDYRKLMEEEDARREAQRAAVTAATDSAGKNDDDDDDDDDYGGLF